MPEPDGGVKVFMLYARKFLADMLANSDWKHYLCTAIRKGCPDGGIGRRAGLKHQWIHLHPGSTPGLGTR